MKAHGTCNVLVTRPKGREVELVAALQEAGFNPVYYPVLEIAPLLESDPAFGALKNRVLDLDLYQHIIFVSMNAVEYGMYWFDMYWPQLPVQQSYYAIGEATAKALAAYNVSVIGSESIAMNSEALIQVGALQQISGDKVLIVRGVGGRDYLYDHLTARGASVEYLQCYRRGLPQCCDYSVKQLLVEQDVDVICANSGESLTNLCTLYGEPLAHLLSLPIVVPGKRVATLAEQKGFTEVICAENAGTHATLKALQCHYN